MQLCLWSKYARHADSDKACKAGWVREGGKTAAVKETADTFSVSSQGGIFEAFGGKGFRVFTLESERNVDASSGYARHQTHEFLMPSRLDVEKPPMLFSEYAVQTENTVISYV